MISRQNNRRELLKSSVFRLTFSGVLLLLAITFGVSIQSSTATSGADNFKIVTDDNYKEILAQKKITFVVLTDDKKEGEEIRNTVAKAAVIFAPDVEEVEFGVWYPFDKKSFPKSIINKTPFLLAVGYGKATNTVLEVPVTYENFFDSVGKFFKHFRTPSGTFSVDFGRSGKIEHSLQAALRECEMNSETTDSCLGNFAKKIPDMKNSFDLNDRLISKVYEEKLQLAAKKSMDALKKEEQMLRSKIQAGGSTKKLQDTVKEHNVIAAISWITDAVKREMSGEL